MRRSPRLAQRLAATAAAMTQEVIRTTVHVRAAGGFPEYWRSVLLNRDIAVLAICPHVHFDRADAQRCADRLNWRMRWQQRLPL